MPFSNYSEALEATRNGEVWGVIHFGQNFTDELVVRQSDGNDADNETIIGSRISISLDWSSKFFVCLFKSLNELVKLEEAHSIHSDTTNFIVSLFITIFFFPTQTNRFH